MADNTASGRSNIRLTVQMQRITFRLPDRLLASLDAESASEGRDLSNMLRRILSLRYGVADTEELDEQQNPELPLT